MKMGLDTLKREGVDTWLLVILASVVVLAVGYKLLHATMQVLIHFGAYAMSDGYRTHPHGNRSELQACRSSAHRRRICCSPSARTRCHQASRAALNIWSTARCRSGGNCRISSTICSSDSSSFGIQYHR